MARGLTVTRFGAAVVVLGALLAFSGCGKSLDPVGLEEPMIWQLEQETGTQVEVDCPDDIGVEAGGKFECTATNDKGESATISAVQKDDQGNIEWTVSEDF
jgi:hypothetical protein